MAEKHTLIRSRSADTTMPGPNLCGQVASNVTSMLHVALIEMCDHKDGAIGKAEIDHIVDLISHSQQFFSVLQGGYLNCVSLKQRSDYSKIDDNTIVHFVLGAYCRDVIGNMFGEEIKQFGAPWRFAFIEGFASFLSDNLGSPLRSQLFEAYIKLVAEHAGALTPLKIINSELVVEALVTLNRLLNTKFREDPTMRKWMEVQLKKSMSDTFAGHAKKPEDLPGSTCTAFLEAVSMPSGANPLRDKVTQKKSD